MKKMWICLFLLLFFLWPVIIFLEREFDASEQISTIISIVIWLGSLIAFGGALTEDCRTDGDLIAGAEDEDGLVFSLKTPVDKLVQKDKVVFHVLKEKKE